MQLESELPKLRQEEWPEIDVASINRGRDALNAQIRRDNRFHEALKSVRIGPAFSDRVDGILYVGADLVRTITLDPIIDIIDRLRPH